jgi:glycosyltransferase involved in cell wall biosynthesis
MIGRVLHVTAPARFGGLERVVTELASGFRERGRDHRVVAVLDRPDPAHPFVEGLRARGVPVEVHVLPARAYRAERRLVLETCDRDHPVVLHTHGYRPDLLHLKTARRARAGIVSTLHGFIGATWRGRFYEAVQVRRLRRFDAVVAVSAPIAERVRRAGVPAERVHLVPNAVADPCPVEPAVARARLGLPAGVRVVGFVGRLTAEKGADVFLDAVARLPDSVHGVVIGEGQERDALEAQCAALGLRPRVRLVGLLPEAGRLLSALDTVVISSRTEGTPMILLEAMAAGVPVVATRVGGVPDVLRDNEGWLVAPEDPSALAAAMIDLLDHPEIARARAAAARLRVQREFGIDQWLARYEAVYARALS